jgi:MFS family permease
MYEFAAFLLFFEAIDERERTSLLTFYNLGHTVAVVVGSSLGGLLLSHVSTGSGSYHWVFGMSSLFRLLTVVFLLRVGFTRVEHAAADLREFAVSLRAIAIRPSSGGWLRPVIPTLPPRRKEDDEDSAKAKDPAREE